MNQVLRRGLLMSIVGLAMGIASLDFVRPAVADDTKVLLDVTYEDGSGRASVQMTMADLNTLPQNGFSTTTIWTDGLQRFDGVWLADLAAHLGVDAGVMELSALNEYLVDFDVSGLAEGRALVATSLNGEPMPPRKKGPLWVVFPYDDSPRFRTETNYALSIWQLDKILVLD